jgi:hypothetical protein
MLKIERSVEAGTVRFALSGRIEPDGLAELERAILGETAGASAISLDLEGVRLLDREAIRFLLGWEAAGVCLARCPAYVRQWIERERNTHPSHGRP